jgi:hypothetical protein
MGNIRIFEICNLRFEIGDYLAPSTASPKSIEKEILLATLLIEVANPSMAKP